ncbi:hypothetical protein [Psychrilyobacter sp.]|uniref:hypothetical protein n=1 Tax=Psychrilyobacter sp. TaxID=2586924 RepID=UPI003018A3EE
MDKYRLIAAYIGEKESLEKTKKTLDWYKDSFEKGDLSGEFSWKWSWWAFLEIGYIYSIENVTLREYLIFY